MNTPPQSVSYTTISEAHAGQRIDNFLMTYLKGVPKSHIYRIIRSGEVRVNKKRVKPLYKLQQDDVIRIPPIRVKNPQAETASGALKQLLFDSILYEDEALVVINKPAGLAAHGGSGIGLGLIEAMRQLGTEYESLDLVHRLDRETSGCILLAKDRRAMRELHTAFRENTVQKTYLALIRGQLAQSPTIETARLGNTVNAHGERIACVTQDGKTAKTQFDVLDDFGFACFVKVQPATGRMHQIRVHAAHLGHPLAGDSKYGDSAFNRAMRELKCKRLFLHAHRLHFQYAGKTHDVSAPIAEDLQAVLTHCEESLRDH